MIKNTYHLLFSLFALTSAWTCLLVILQGMVSDSGFGIYLLLLYTAGLGLILSLMSIAIYILLLKPLFVLKKSLEKNTLPHIDALSDVSDGISRILASSVDSSSLLIEKAQTSRQRILALNEILETNIIQLKSEIREIKEKYHDNREYQQDIADLCQSHQELFTGYFNLLAAHASSEHLQADAKMNNRTRFFQERIFDAATHLNFLIRNLPDQDFDNSSSNKERLVDIRQSVDETIACIQPSLANPGFDGTNKSGLEIIPFTEPECPELITFYPLFLKSLLFHFINHCLTDLRSHDEKIILELRISFSREENILAIASNYFPSSHSSSMTKLEEYCLDSTAKIHKGKLLIPTSKVEEHSSETADLYKKNILVIDENKQWCDSILSRLNKIGPYSSTARSLSEVNFLSLQKCELIISRRINGAMLNQEAPLLIIGNLDVSESFHHIYPPLTQQKFKNQMSIIFTSKSRTTDGRINTAKPVLAGKEGEKLLFDAELSLSIANHDLDIATEMLEILIETLPGDINKISTALKRENWNEVKKEVHRLSGAVRFCGVPQLQDCIDKLGKTLRSEDYKPADALIKLLNSNANDLQSWYRRTAEPFNLAPGKGS